MSKKNKNLNRRNTAPDGSPATPGQPVAKDKYLYDSDKTMAGKVPEPAEWEKNQQKEINEGKDPSYDGLKTGKGPSILKMASNFASDLVKYVKEGAPNVSQRTYVERLDACKKCPHLLPENMRCGKCGCLLEHKAKWKTTTCPDEPSRWRPLYLSHDDTKKVAAAKKIYERNKKHEAEQAKEDSKEKQRAINIGKKLKRARAQGRWDPSRMNEVNNEIRIRPEKPEDAKTARELRGFKNPVREQGEEDKDF